MTWMSLRSGIASSGTVVIDHQPATTATVTRMKTIKRFFAENSMMALITAVSCMWIGRGAAVLLVLWRAHSACRRLQLALGVDEERAARDDTLAGRQPFCDRDAIAKPLACDDLT